MSRLEDFGDRMAEVVASLVVPLALMGLLGLIAFAVVKWAWQTVFR